MTVVLGVPLVLCGGFQFFNNPGKTNRATSTDRTWTKFDTPAWATQLDPDVRTTFSKLMNDESPLYTGFYCDGSSIRVYINRVEWKALTKFQATNHLMLSIFFPHTDQTLIAYVDDRTGEVLAAFTPKQTMGSITVVHP